MMSPKFLLNPSRLRRVPARFSWLDQRLIREGHLRGCGAEAWALYLFLVLVADAQGLSWYSERRLCLELRTDPTGLAKARCTLQDADLIAYAVPFYQVLELPAGARTRSQAVPAAGSGTREVGAGAGEAPANREQVRGIIERTFGKRSLS